MREKLGHILKFLVFVLVLPVVIAVTTSFGKTLLVAAYFSQFFLWGIHIYVIVHLFVFEPQGIFNFGQRVVYEIFKFSEIVARVARRIIPFYTTLFVILFFFSDKVFDFGYLRSCLIFLTGFSLAMHIIMVAKELHEGDANAIKPHYMLMMCFTYMVVLLILGLVFSLILPEMQFNEFMNRIVVFSKRIYVGVFRQLF